jgi:hypothetical protein
VVLVVVVMLLLLLLLLLLVQVMMRHQHSLGNETLVQQSGFLLRTFRRSLDDTLNVFDFVNSIEIDD